MPTRSRWLYTFAMDEDALDWIGEDSFSATEHCPTPGIPELSPHWLYVVDAERDFVCLAEERTARAIVALLNAVGGGHGYGSLGLASLELARYVESCGPSAHWPYEDAAKVLRAAGEPFRDRLGG